MAGTGVLMWRTGLIPLISRTSATFVHDWFALAAGTVLAGHIGLAVTDPETRRAMRTGFADRAWARREHPLWQAEFEKGGDAGDGWDAGDAGDGEDGTEAEAGARPPGGGLGARS